jgi:arginase
MRLQALAVSYDSGMHGKRMGAGPEHLISAGLFDDLSTRADVAIDRFTSESDIQHAEIASAFEIAAWLAARVSAARRDGAFPLVLAGNCMSAMGTVAGLQSRSRRVPGVCWFDAHADFNTPETTLSGFLDGMALATLTGRCWPSLVGKIPGFRAIPESQVLLFGARDLDAAERRALSASDVHFMKVLGNESDATLELENLRDRFGEVYLHIDLDVLDPSEGRANVFASPGGFTGDRLIQLIEEISRSFHVGAAALTAYDPSCDPENRIPAIARRIVGAISRGMR